jgi:beta-lactamase regulating signal transducer with metallopeptidase domain
MAASLLVQLAIKASLVLVATWLVAGAMRRGSAAARHLVWTLGITATFALPLVRAIGPTWVVAVPESAWFAAVAPAADRALTISPAPDQPLFPAQATRSLESAITVPAASHESTPSRCAGARCAGAPVRTLTPSMASDSAASGATSAAVIRMPRLTPAGWGILVWLVGVALLFARLINGFVRAGRIAQRAEPVTDTAWLVAFDQAAAAMAIDRPVALRQTEETSVPMACGLWRPTVLVPRDTASWTDERRMVVLLHELAHVRRRDCLVQALAQATCALHWVNPLAHVALRRIRSEQERACDDLVLAAGADAPDYADHLFEIARSFRAPSAPAFATLAMARPSQLEGRLMAILDERCNRAPLAARARRAATLSAILAIVALGALHVTAATSATASAMATAPMASTGEPSLASAPSPIALAFQVFERVTSHTADRMASADHIAAHPDPEPNPDPGPNPEPDASPSPAIRTPGIIAASFAMAAAAMQQPPSAPQAPPVTDETRRRVADALATALNDENEDVRSQALSSLAAMRDARAVPALLKALRDPSVRLRERAISGLTQFDTPEALDGLMSGLKDSSPEVREHAARSVGARLRSSQLQDPKYTDAFLALLKDQVPDVREQAIVLLGRMRARQAVPSLLPLLKDSTIDIRERAAQALGMIADPAAIDALTAALKDADAGVREQAAIALGQIARGQRRDGPPPGFVPPAPPIPPVTPRRPVVRLDLDREHIDEIARKALEQSAAEVERSLADLDKTIDKSLDKAFEKSR